MLIHRYIVLVQIRPLWIMIFYMRVEFYVLLFIRHNIYIQLKTY